ncbi:hypothetical protein E2562_001869 [Oryza meyeriana var. granulata]|uniref:Uncharacterized protein n=1 Tax=Oryza meyeriana var. granulata TaxID=110450 RepID=A0A6G1C294_9ORYZ|nr:hypothetical protein E2562_001869 [Oryza meyeriana var. granulata]
MRRRRLTGEGKEAAVQRREEVALRRTPRRARRRRWWEEIGEEWDACWGEEIAGRRGMRVKSPRYKGTQSPEKQDRG